MTTWIAYIDRRKLESKSLSLGDVCAPHDVLNNRVGVLLHFPAGETLDEVLKREPYYGYENDPDFVRKILSGN